MKGKTSSEKSILMKILFLILAAVLCLSTIFMTACAGQGDENEDEEDDDIVVSEPADEQLIKNGNFNFLYDTSDSLDYPRTPKSWSYSIDGSGDNKAPSSSSDLLYGVINVDADKFAKVNEKKDDKDPKFGTIADKSVAIENPKSPNGVTNEKDHVLMLYNKNATAIRYKSPAITIAANVNAKITVWVKTLGITDGGAHINITGGVEEPVYIKNINTSGAPNDNGNNGYVEYSFYFAGSTTQSKTIYLELGLGYGDKTVQREHAQGYAFFDDVQINYYSPTDIVKDLGDKDYESFEVDGDPFDENIYDSNDKTVFAYSFDRQHSVYDSFLDSAALYNNIDNTAINGNTNADASFRKVATSNIETAGLSDDQKKDLEKFPFVSSDVYVMENLSKTSSMLKVKLSSDDSASKFGAYKFYRMSFWLKTSEFDDSTGFSTHITNGWDKYKPHNPLVGEKGYVSYGNLSNLSTPKDNKDLEDEDLAPEYKTQNWQLVDIYFSIGNYQDEEAYLELYIGPQKVDTITNGDQYKWDLIKGYALMTDPRISEVTKGEYNATSTGTYSTKMSISTSSSPTTTVANGGFSTPVTAYGTPDFSGDPLAPADWIGYPYSHQQMGGNGVAPDDTKALTHGITNKLLSGNILPSGNPTCLVISADGSNPTSYGYITPYKSLSANSYYRISVDVMSNAPFGIYLTDKEGKILSNSEYKQKPPAEPSEDDKEDEDKEEEDPTDFDRFLADGKAQMYFEDATAGTISSDGTGWKTYNFYVKTLNDAKDIRIELWLGQKTKGQDAARKVSGTAYFDNVQITSSATSIFESAVKKQIDAGTMTKVTDDNKEIIVENSKDMYFKDNTAGIIICDYTKANPTPPTEEEEEEEGTEEEEETPFNWGILLTGIATILMVVALGIVFVTKLVRRKKNHPSVVKAKKSKVTSNYDKTLKRGGSSNHSDDDDDDDDSEELEEDEDDNDDDDSTEELEELDGEENAEEDEELELDNNIDLDEEEKE